MNLKYDLNRQQQKTVEKTDGPLLVLAGAGSGKTRCLSYRTAKMIKDGINPKNILTLTFTNKAADEMEKRIEEMVGKKIKESWIGTFHSVGLRILSNHLTAIGYYPNYTILDSEDSEQLIEDIINEFNFDHSLDAQTTFKSISNSKMQLISPEFFVSNYVDKEPNDFHYMIESVYMRYQEVLKDCNSFDFNDLIMKPIFLLRKNDVIRDKYQNKFKYIQVDEFQDTNYSQNEFAKLLAPPQNNVFAVGDLDQCQPSGTKVLTTTGYKNIEELNPDKDKVLSYDTKNSCIVGLNNGYNFEKAIRPFSGSLNIIKTKSGKVSKSTDNHKWLVKTSEDYDKEKVQEVFAFNLLPEKMSIPVYTDGSGYRWEKIVSLKRKHYEGPVYSLDVKKHHKYISDGMITCNSIYGFRGATIKNILKFNKNFPNAEIQKLERNYRSSQNIVRASNEVIKNNQQRKEKVCWTSKGPGPKIVVSHNPDEIAEAEFVAKTIQHMGYSYNDIYILYRSHYLSNNFEQEFIDRNIPYEIIGNSQFFNRKEIKQFIHFLKFTVNPLDNVALGTVLSLFNNDVGPKTISKIKKNSLETGVKIIDLLDSAENIKGIGRVRANSLKNFKDEYLDELIRINKKEIDSYEKAEQVYELVCDEIINNFDNPIERKENIDELLNFIKRYVDKNKDIKLQKILKDIMLSSEQDDLEEKSNTVKMMSVHAAKGLENKVVFVVGLEEEIFPHYRALEENDFEGLEEERRLFYVAMTRAEERLFLTYSSSRIQFGQVTSKSPSCFISEIPDIYKKEIYQKEEQLA